MEDIYLIVTIDTEEDNWGFKRETLAVENIQYISSVQTIFDSFGIKPVYLCTFPVVENPESCKILTDLFARDKCDIGTHLHPWNTPPMVEDNTDFNSQLKNLPYDLVRTKLYNLTERIAAEFNVHPSIFRAGRWGLGVNVIKALIDLEYDIDTSVTPFVTWNNYGQGADFSLFPFAGSYYINSNGKIDRQGSHLNNILEIPVSIGFNRTPFRLWSIADNIIRLPLFTKLRLPGIFDKIYLLRKIWLSPEFNDANDMLLLSKLLLKSGINLFNFTFHSTSLIPGLDPFVKTDDELKAFLKNIEDYLRGLRSIGNIISITSKEIPPLVEAGKIRCLPNCLK